MGKTYKDSVVRKDWWNQYPTDQERNNSWQGKPFKKAYGPPKGSPATQTSVFNTPRNLPFTTKHALVKVVARYGSSGVTGAQNIRVLIYNPSERLRFGVVVAFEPDSPPSADPAFVIAPQWSITAIGKNPESGRESPLQLIYPAAGTTQLPDSYEFDSTVDIARLNIVLQDTNFSTSYVAANSFVNCVVYCTWEPNEPINNDELERLYSKCSISCTPTPLAITNNAA